MPVGLVVGGERLDQIRSPAGDDHPRLFDDLGGAGDLLFNLGEVGKKLAGGFLEQRPDLVGEVGIDECLPAPNSRAICSR